MKILEKKLSISSKVFLFIIISIDFFPSLVISSLYKNYLIAKIPSKHTYFMMGTISLNPALVNKSKLPCDENGSKTPLRLLVFPRISSAEYPFSNLNSL